MTWIKEAEQAGVEEAARKKAEWQHFNSEKVTEEATLEFLQNHFKPVNPIIEDLQNSGYTVRKTGPGFLPDQYESDNPYVREVTLSRRAPTDTGEYFGIKVELFGVKWEILKGSGDKKQKLGSVTIHPTISESTHYGGVQYTALSHDGQLIVATSHSQKTAADGLVNHNLKQTIGDWIRKSSM